MKYLSLMAVSGLLLTSNQALAIEVNPITHLDRTAIGEGNSSHGDGAPGGNGD